MNNFGIKVTGMEEAQNFTSSHRKENNSWSGWQVISLDKGRLRTIVDLRVYWPNRNAETVHACVWINGEDFYTKGSGTAGGWGYDKASAAAESALARAGVEFNRHWGGGGKSATEEAILAVAKKLYPRRKMYIVYAHA